MTLLPMSGLTKLCGLIWFHSPSVSTVFLSTPHTHMNLVILCWTWQTSTATQTITYKNSNEPLMNILFRKCNHKVVWRLHQREIE